MAEATVTAKATCEDVLLGVYCNLEKEEEGGGGGGGGAGADRER